MKRLEAALKAFGPGFHVYQYLFKSNRPDIPFAKYDDPIVASSDRTSGESSLKRSATIFIRLKSSTAFCSKAPGRRPASARRLARLLRDPRARFGELKAQFTNDSMKTSVAHAYRARSSTARPARAGIRSTARGLHANRSLESTGTIHVSSAACSITTTGALPAGRSPRSFSTIRSSTPTSKPNAIICASAITSSGC